MKNALRKALIPIQIVGYMSFWMLALSGCRGQLEVAGLDRTPTINSPVSLPNKIENWPEIHGRHPEVPSEYTPVAENDALRLYLNQKTSAIQVEDRRSGFLWRSSPADLSQNKEVSTAWKRQIESPVLVNYVDPERSQAKLARPDRVSIQYQPVVDGVRASYQFTQYALGFDVLYTLREDCLEVTIPEESVVEAEGNGLISVDILSFLGATHDGEEGYIVFPDGSGALMHFTTPHPEAVQRITSVVYGKDIISLDKPASAITTDFDEQVVMPVFGLVSGNAAFVAMITQGDFDATISVARSGKGVDYNHVWAEFIYRRQGRFSLTGGQPAWLYQPDRILGDRQVHYCFLNDQEANYVGMAQRYRQFLIQDRGAKRIGGNVPLLHLALFMGIERRTWFLRDMIPMTTFSEAQGILKDLDQQGVRRIDVTLWNWNQGGVGGRYPKRLPVEDRLGGEEGLKSLAAETASYGQRLFLQDNYLLVMPGSAEVMPYLDVLRGVDGLPAGNGEVGYLLNPQIAIRRFALRDLPKIDRLGANGIMLDGLANLVLPDKNTLYPLSRENFAASWMQLANMVRKDFGYVAASGCNSYAVPYFDRLDIVTVDSTHYDLFDETIPFYHIAVHGLVVYSGQPFNLISDNQRMLLRHIEYGTIPYFMLSQASSARLFRTSANLIWSSQYSFWRDELIRQYRMMEELAPLIPQFIIGHGCLTDGICQTTYEDGTRVIVNYTSEPFTIDNIVIPAMDFKVISGGE